MQNPRNVKTHKIVFWLRPLIDEWTVLYKILLKSISITNYIFKKNFTYFCQLL